MEQIYRSKLRFFTARQLKPSGWLKRQLRIQADGLSGHLDKIWPDVRDSAWIGGDREGWERVPDWLDGFVPLAYLLEDEDLIARARKYVDAILAAQRPERPDLPLPARSAQRLRYLGRVPQLQSADGLRRLQRRRARRRGDLPHNEKPRKPPACLHAFRMGPEPLV